MLINATPAQAKKSGEFARQMSRELKSSSEQRRVPAREDALPISALGKPDTQNLLRSQLSRLSLRDGGIDNIEPETRSLVVALVLALHESAPYRVNQLVMELEAEGNFGAAELVRDIVGGGRRGGVTPRLSGW